MSDREFRRLQRLSRETPEDEELQRQLERVARRVNRCPTCGAIPREGFTYCISCEPLCVIWDSYAEIEAQAEYLREEDPELSEEEAFNQASMDDYSHTYEWIGSEIGQWIEELNEYESDWYHVEGGDSINWNPRIREKTGTEAYFRELGYTFIRTMSLENSDNYTVCYNGTSLIVDNTDTYVPAHLCEICEEAYPTEQEAENCCYLCEICDDPHKSPEAAANCCFVCPHCTTIVDYGFGYGTREIPTVYKTREEMENCCFICLKCEAVYETEQEALDCDCT